MEEMKTKQTIIKFFSGVRDIELIGMAIVLIIFVVMLIHPIPFYWDANQVNTSSILYHQEQNNLNDIVTASVSTSPSIVYKFSRIDSPEQEIKISRDTITLDFDYYKDNVTGSSMEPGILAGDILFFKHQDSPGEIKEGYIIDCTFKEEGDKYSQSTVHRVVGVYSGFFLTQGDRNMYSDEHYCLYNEVKGYLVAIVPGGKIAN